MKIYLLPFPKIGKFYGFNQKTQLLNIFVLFHKLNLDIKMSKEELGKLLTLILAMLATNAVSERSFPSLTKNNTYLPSTATNNQLNHQNFA